jgi:hypothetical protein
LVSERARYCEDITIGVPFDALYNHPSVYKDGTVICFFPHELHTPTSIGNAKLCRIFIKIFIEEALSIGIVPLYPSKRHFPAFQASEAEDLNGEEEITHIVIYINSSIRSTKQDASGVW